MKYERSQYFFGNYCFYTNINLAHWKYNRDPYAPFLGPQRLFFSLCKLYWHISKYLVCQHTFGVCIIHTLYRPHTCQSEHSRLPRM